MHGRWSSSRWSLAVVAMMMLLLAVLATLQYRWIARLSEAERQRLERSLDNATGEMCRDFDLELTRAHRCFSLDEPATDHRLAELIAMRLQRWRSEAPWPGLVQDIYVLRPDGDRLTLLIFDASETALVAAPWEAPLAELRRRLHEQGPPSPLDELLPGLVVAVHRAVGAQARQSPVRWQAPRDHLLVRFDLAFISGQLLPELAHRHLATDEGMEYAFSVALAAHPDEELFHFGSPTLGADRADANALLFALREADVSSADDPRLDRRPPPRDARASGARAQRPGSRLQQPPPRQAVLGRTDGRWLLRVFYPTGSLEEAVSRARRRNLALSLATLALLGVTALLMVGSSRRLQHLARQQMDFVAAVSHELRTPLTAIRSAGQNLADGIIHDPDKVRSYGLLIEREGRRLTEMIGRVLSFAGIRSGQLSFRKAPVAVAEIVHTTLADCRWILEEKGVEVAAQIATDLPLVEGDASALRQVVTNLIDNAVKYGAAGGWLGVRASSEERRGRTTVVITVADRGPGIGKREQVRIFEPFYRTAEASAGRTPGSGLGLAVVRSIVEAHGGRVELSSRPGHGTTFTVRLPALEEPTEDSE